MEEQYVTDRSFEGQDFTASPPARAEYEHCAFSHCNFSGTDLSGFRFSECTFTDCNLSLVQLKDTALRNVVFRNCKMLGVHVDVCNTFGLELRFDNCVLNHSSFYQLKLKKTAFFRTRLEETDFTGCDLTSAVFAECDLLNATFDQTILEKADLRSAYNYSIDPSRNRIKKALFSLQGLPGLLHNYDIVIE